MLNYDNVAIGLEVLYYPSSEKSWIDIDFIGKENYPATVKFVGQVTGKTGPWVGICFNSPIGKHSGLYRGIQYFSCSNKHGIFTQPHKLVKVCRPRRSKDNYCSPSSSLSIEHHNVNAKCSAIISKDYLEKSKDSFQGYINWSPKNYHKPQILSRVVKLQSN